MRNCSFTQTAIRSSESLTIRLGVKSQVGSDEPAFNGFKGFLIMAFDATGVDIEPIGVFNDPASSDIQTLDCPSSTQVRKTKVRPRNRSFKVGLGEILFEFINPSSLYGKWDQVGVTHTDNNLKKSVEVVWTPPVDYVGPVIIQQVYFLISIFWSNGTACF